MRIDYERPWPRFGHILAAIGFWIGLITAFAVLGGALVIAAAGAARAHDALPTAAAPLGWSYPFSCCSGYDCREVTSGPEGMIRETPEGYQIATTGEVIPYSDKRVKESPDGAFHWCSVMGKDDSRTICIFAPPRSF